MTDEKTDEKTPVVSSLADRGFAGAGGPAA
jgi:hypothetical protein